MTAGSDPRQDAGFLALQQRYLSELRVELNTFERMLREGDSAELTSETRERLRRFAHNWKGSGGTYGYPDISHFAASLEVAVRDGATIEVIDALFERVLSVHRELCHDHGQR